MDKDKLKKAYEAVEMLKALDLPVSREQMNAIAELERECLKEEVVPCIEKILKPIVANMNTSFRIEIGYTPEGGLSIETSENKRAYRRASSPEEQDAEQRARENAGILRVTFPDGRVIENTKVARTLLDVVEIIGFEEVEKLNWVVSSQPFVSRIPYPRRQKQRNGWYVTTHSNTLFKKKQIEDLSRIFKLNLKVELVD